MLLVTLLLILLIILLFILLGDSLMIGGSVTPKIRNNSKTINFIDDNYIPINGIIDKFFIIYSFFINISNNKQKILLIKFIINIINNKFIIIIINIIIYYNY